jgi:hypothetical protein
MNEPTVRFMLRIPTTLKVKLTELAAREHRSLNKQIEFMLDRSIQESDAKDATHSSASTTEPSRRPKLR